MAATRLIALHVNKGKTVAQCLADRTDYSQNAAKTNDGEFISSYECDPKTADEEFLLSKRQYQHITGRQQKNSQERFSFWYERFDLEGAHGMPKWFKLPLAECRPLLISRNGT